MMPMLTTVDIAPEYPDVITVDCSYHVKEIVKRVPGARWNQDGRRVWTVPLTWGSCLALRTEFGDNLVIGPDLRRWASATKTEHDAMVALRASLHPTDDFDPGTEPGWEVLFPYQLSGAELISKSHGRYMLLDETGCGKSRTGLAGLAKLDEPWPALIVAPKSMLLTWENELNSFFGPSLDIRVVAGTPGQRKKLLEPGGDVYIISYGSLRQHSKLSHFGKAKVTDAQREPKELQAIDFRTVLVDEAHRAKNPTAAQTRALWAASGDAAYRLAMTGTPVQENAEDLWALLHFVMPEVFTSKTAYVDRFLQIDWNRWGGREITGLKPGAEAEFFAIFDAMTRRVTKEAALPFLPPKLYEVRWVELPPKLRRAYNSMQQDLIAELETTTVSAKSVLERAGRLLQLANASGEVDADGKYHMMMPSPKIEAFVDDLIAGDFDGQSVVVFSDSRQLIDLLSAELTRIDRTHVMITGDVTGDDRQEAMEKFQSGEVDLILITRAGGTGITLTKASTMVRLVRPWSFTEHAQAEDRVHRIGSEMHESVTYIDYVTMDSVEEGQLVRLNAKGATAQEILRDSDLLEMLKGK